MMQSELSPSHSLIKDKTWKEDPHLVAGISDLQVGQLISNTMATSGFTVAKLLYKFLLNFEKLCTFYSLIYTQCQAHRI